MKLEAKFPQKVRQGSKLHLKSASGVHGEWMATCRLAGVDTKVFNKFRSIPIAKLVVDGYPKRAAYEYLISIKDKPHFPEIIKFWAESDTVCSPSTKINYSFNGVRYVITPATGRYIRNVYNLVDLFGPDILKGTICEVGAGFGGDSKIFQDFKSLFGYSGGEYYIFDLPSSVGLIRRYLKNFNYPATFKDLFESKSLPKKYDLIISNAAFSEMRSPLIETYFDKVVSKADRGYFIVNFESHSAPYGGWTVEKFIKKLKAAGKVNPTVIEPDLFLSPFDAQYCKLVVFGVKNLPKSTTKHTRLLRLVSSIQQKTRPFKQIIKKLL